MTNDSKMGLLAGLTVVLLVAVVFYQKRPSLNGTPSTVPTYRQSSPNPIGPVSTTNIPVSLPTHQ